MSIISALPASFASDYMIENLFSLQINQTKNRTAIQMALLTPSVNTIDFPKTYSLLERHLPSILVATCFNDEQLPFASEVKRTEIGHLFEHILLEYLCQFKLLQGYDTACYAGRTNWNWVKNPRGTFHIVVDAGHTDATIFPSALGKTIKLTSQILQSEIQINSSLTQTSAALLEQNSVPILQNKQTN